MLAQRAASIATCTPCPPATMSSSQILVRIAPVESGEFSLRLDEDYTLLTPLGDGSSKLSFECNPTFVEGERKLSAEGKECAFSIKEKQDGSIERGGAMEVKQDGSESALETLRREKPGEEDEAEQCAEERDHPVKPTVDVDACITQIDKLDVQEVQKPPVGQGELSPTDKDMRSADPPTQTASPASNDDVCADPPMQTASPASNDDVSNLLHEKSSKEQGSVTPPPRKPAAWHAPEHEPGVVEELEFVMEASSWPTLAEARHAKPSEGRSSPAHKETTPVTSAAAAVQKENSMEAPKQLNTNHSHPGPRYRSSYRKGSGAGYGRPNFPATGKLYVHPLPVEEHVPNANTYHPDQSIKGSGRGGINNVFPSPYQAPANAPLYQHNRGEGLAPFPHTAVGMLPYGRGFPGGQHHARGYSGPVYDQQHHARGYSGPVYDQRHIGPRYIHPPMASSMNFNAAHYNYPHFPGDMSYMPSGFGPPFYNHANPPYVGPFQPPAVAMHGWDTTTILERLQKQIEYYFSKENLIKDIFLTSQMDEEGFVPLALIASFPRVQSLTWDSRLIVEALKNSSAVEVKNGKLRSLEWRRQPSATSRTNGAENGESSAPSSSTTVDHTREQAPEISREQVSEISGEGGGQDDPRTSGQQ